MCERRGFWHDIDRAVKYVYQGILLTLTGLEAWHMTDEPPNPDLAPVPTTLHQSEPAHPTRFPSPSLACMRCPSRSHKKSFGGAPSRSTFRFLLRRLYKQKQQQQQQRLHVVEEQYECNDCSHISSSKQVFVAFLLL